MDLIKKISIVSDLDGTVFLGKKPIKGTVKFIKRFSGEKEFFFFSNNTSMIPEDYIVRLNSFGIKTDRNHIIAPHIPLIKYLRKENINNIYLLATQKYTQFLKSEMLDLCINDDIDNCQAVIVAYDTELTYVKLKNAALILQKDNIKYLATHCDKVCPTENGPIPDAGSILALLDSATSRKPDIIFGKPNQELLSSVLSKYKSHEIVIVGDRLYTDKILADNAGIDFILVLSGESTRLDAEKCESNPKLIVNDLGDLLDK
ncbi:MAG: HAD-IIA family hydrolase [candidate division Zixibacteria bacterium]|nr:HAD-IIA family hydrolase [candidate division Zixibacteria bacterium]